MALPKDVQNAVAQLDNAMMFHADDLSYASWTAVRAHLMSQDAEIARYKVAWTEYNDRTEWVQKTAKPKELGLHRADVLRLRIESAESRLAAADELLREAEGELRCACQSRKAAHISQDIRVYLASFAAHLSENTHG